MEKRGQVTIFIIIGIVVLIVIGVVFFIIYSPVAPQISPEQFSEVQKYVDSCVEQTMRDGVVYLGRGPHADYNKALAEYVTEYLVYCPNFTADFPELEVLPKDIVSVEVSLNQDKSMVSAVVVYPISVKKGSYTKTLERFYAEYALINKYCADVNVDSDCKSTSDTPVTTKVAGLTFTFNKGDFVGISDKCIACK
jgi:hypothetical protein